ncbi:MAG: CHASE2 domain-containing protein [Chitinispirillaceae bacterium]
MKGDLAKRIKQTFSSLPAKRRMTLWMGSAALVAFCLSALLYSFPSINVIEWRLADLWATSRYGNSVDEKVAVIGIDEAIFEEFDWPLEKDVYGDLIAFLDEAGAEVIAFDIIFSDNLDACGKSDSIFLGMVQWYPKVVFGFGAVANRSQHGAPTSATKSIPHRFACGNGTVPGYTVHQTILPYKNLLENIHSLGSVILGSPFPDGIDRRTSLFLSQDSLLYPSLGLRAASIAEDHSDVAWDKNTNQVRIGKHRVWTDEEGHIYLNFSSKIPFYSLSDVRQSHIQMIMGEKPSIGREQLEGRIVFVGNSAPSLGDLGTTPVSVKESGMRSPNVMLHARTAATILNDNAIRFHGRQISLLVSLFLVLLFALLYRFVPMKYSFLISFAILGAFLYLSKLFYNSNEFVPFLESMTAGGIFIVFASFGIYLENDSDRRFLFNTFGKYISPALIEDMAQNNVKPELGGQEVYGSAFFSDIESFSRLSEKITPFELISYLNEYFSAMTHTLLDNKGTLDKYIGDAIVAFFGAPRPSLNHAAEACTAAVNMQETLSQLRKKWQKQSHIPKEIAHLKMRIGINTGNFVTGNMGCDLRMNYTMLGDTVNLASRLEGAAKEYGIYTVIGENTYKHVKERFLLRKIDSIRVVGKNRSTNIYQLIGKPRTDDDQIQELIEIYEKGLQHHARGAFAEAKKLFEKSLLLERFPELKNPSRVMLARAENYILNPPQDWDGVHLMVNK